MGLTMLSHLKSPCTMPPSHPSSFGQFLAYQSTRYLKLGISPTGSPVLESLTAACASEMRVNDLQQIRGRQP